jgi:DNA-binding response OmpR family regulator
MSTGAPGNASGRPPQPTLAILFVDPDRVSAERLAHALRGSYLIAFAPTFVAARSAMSQRTPDLVITEMDLPDGNGVDLLASLRGAPATRHVLLMAVTHRSLVGDKIAALQAGADDYLVKPVSPDQFDTHVQLISRFRRVIRG